VRDGRYVDVGIAAQIDRMAHRPGLHGGLRGRGGLRRLEQQRHVV
jgi:hypothetical protein